MSESIAGHCGKCGAPYFMPDVWFGICPPSPQATCLCWNQGKTITSSTVVVDPSPYTIISTGDKKEGE
jgi:hypothetical protein